MYKLVLPLLTLAVAGCLTHTSAVHKQYLPPQPRAQRTCWKGVRVYVMPDSIPGPYQRLALLRSTGNMVATDNALVKGLRQKAAQMGANGLVLHGTDPGGLWVYPMGHGLAIWVPADSARSAAECAPKVMRDSTDREAKASRP